MRLLEERHPGVSFDWGRILRDPPQQIPEEQAARRREQREAREAKRKKKRSAEPESTEPSITAEPAEPSQGTSLEPIEPTPAIPSSSASNLLGPEGAAHLRSRYTVLMQRIERLPDEARRAELGREAAPLNPNSWETLEAARLAMDTFEQRYEALRAQVGGGRRRRRRRRGGGKSGGGQPPTDGV